MKRGRQFPFAVAVAAFSLVGLLVGCSGSGGPEVKTVTVSGKVTFQGQPVEEGTITFENTETGHVGSAELGSEGAYSVELPVGHYAVAITPPMVEVPNTADSPGGEDFKDVDNIPEKYWNSATSGLTAQVDENNTTHDFDMKP